VAALVIPTMSKAAIIKGGLPWTPGPANPPTPVTPGPWMFFTSTEGATVEAMVDRLIPPDPETPGGKDTGCAVFIDRQLAGPYGTFAERYMGGPFQKGTPEQGDQSSLVPRQRFRIALAEIDKHCQATLNGATFTKLTPEQQDQVLGDLEQGKIPLGDVETKTFFQNLVILTQQGFFADPIYGGNRGMAAWKMIGFPGAHYDYRDWVHRHNERYPYPPVGIADHPAWNQ
jgi:gluconate 2-dehydrogenase gamma chain